MKVRYTVPSSLNRVAYVGNGVTQVFPVSYNFFVGSDLRVTLVDTTTGIETVQVITTNYTVTGGGGDNGSITMLVAPPTGTTLVIERDIPYTQEIDLEPNDPFPAEVTEEGFDRSVMLAQQNLDKVERALKVPTADANDPTDLPIVALRAGKYLGFDNDGNPVALPAPTGGSADSVSFLQAGSGAVSRTVQSRLRDTISVLDFIPVSLHAAILARTHVDPLETYIQAAVEAAGANNGGRILLPRGTYTWGTLIDVPYANVMFQGDGGDGHHGVGTQGATAATVLKWIGADGGTMMHIRSPEGASNQKLYGGGAHDLYWDSGVTTANTGADYGLRISSRDQGSYENLFFRAFRVRGLRLDCVTTLGEVRDTQNNRFVNCHSRNTYDNTDGGLLELMGDETLVATPANVSLNTFYDCGAVFNAGVAYKFGDSDHNWFINCRANRLFHDTSGTVTMTIADPCVASWTGHGMVDGMVTRFTTTGALPTGLAVGTNYYISVIDANTFKLATSLANRVAGTFIETTGGQSGVHTAYKTGGAGIEFLGNNASSALVARANSFMGWNGGDIIRAHGTDTYTYASFDNIFHSMAYSNYTPMPTLGTGASAPVHGRDDGTNVRPLMVTAAFGGPSLTGQGINTTSLLMKEIRGRMANETMRVSNPSSDHIRLETPASDYLSVTAEWSVALDSSGNIKFTRVTGTGVPTSTAGWKSTNSTLGIGYATGAGGTVVQATDKSTFVSLNRVCGKITMHAANLVAGTAVTFQMVNSALAAGDVIVLNHDSAAGGTAGAYALSARTIAGNAFITVRNLTAGDLAEAAAINFAVVKAVQA